MDLKRLRCVVAVADAMHFGRAAQSLDMLPAALGRQVRALEDELGVALFERTTRSVALTGEGREFVAEARALIERADALAETFRTRGRAARTVLRLGAIDSAAAGLVPHLITDLRERLPGLSVQLTEDKSLRLVPKLLSGRLDLAFVRPGARHDPRLASRLLLNEVAVVALPAGHPLCAGDVAVADLADVAMIIPERRSRPHSYDATIKLFEEAGLTPRIAQIAEEKQTILVMVAAGIGAAIVPLWSSRLAVPGVAFRRLAGGQATGGNRLPLAAMWQAKVRDPNRDAILALIERNLARYAAQELPG